MGAGAECAGQTVRPRAGARLRREISTRDCARAMPMEVAKATASNRQKTLDVFEAWQGWHVLAGEEVEAPL